MQLHQIEAQLQKRLAYPYRWHVKQNNNYDALTNFIYTSDNFDHILNQINASLSEHPNSEELRDYALNRWFNYWSSQAVEYIFSLSKRVVPTSNMRNRTIDFTIDGINIDHKTSVFPNRYPHSLKYAQDNPEDLIQWLYSHQSQEQRKHLKNRLFIVLYASSGQHWKLKAEIAWLKAIIDEYIDHFSASRLHTFHFDTTSTTLSDIIWGVK